MEENCKMECINLNYSLEHKISSKNMRVGFDYLLGVVEEIVRWYVFAVLRPSCLSISKLAIVRILYYRYSLKSVSTSVHLVTHIS